MRKTNCRDAINRVSTLIK